MERLKQLLNAFSYSFSQSSMFFAIMRQPSMRKYIIEQLIQKNQLLKYGVDERNKVIGYYSLTTQLISGGKKKFGSPYTLKDTGAFYKSMYIRANPQYIEIDADPIKKGEGQATTNLFQEYGEGIIGLTDDSKNKLANKTLDLCKRYLQGELERILR